MKYRRKPLIIEAMKFDGTDMNMDMLSNFLGTDTLKVSYSDPLCPTLIINEHEKKFVPKGWYVARTDIGEIFVIHPYDFERDYERIE